MWTLCSIGSNIEPINNTALALTRLARLFGQVQLSPLVRTRAVAVTGQQDFLNAFIRFESDASDFELKQQLNAIEIDLGRDRSHRDSKILPRPMDIDILDRQRSLERLKPNESTPYLNAVWQAEQAGQLDQTWSVEVAGVLLGQMPATINFDHATGQVRVVTQQTNRVEHRGKASLAS